MSITFPVRIEERVFLGEESRNVAIPYLFVSLPDQRNGTRFRHKPQSGTESCFPLCGNAVNAGSKHPFADTSGPQRDVLGPIVLKPCCIANVHEE